MEQEVLDAVALGRKRRGQTKRTLPGVQATVFARVHGDNRHVTVYPVLKGAGSVTETDYPDTDFTLADAEGLLAARKWHPIRDWVKLEYGVWSTVAVKLP